MINDTVHKIDEIYCFIPDLNTKEKRMDNNNFLTSKDIIQLKDE